MINHYKVVTNIYGSIYRWNGADNKWYWYCKTNSKVITKPTTAKIEDLKIKP